MPRTDASRIGTRSGASSSERLRRLRTTPAIRELLAEVRTAPSRLVYPVFLRPSEGRPEAIPSLPGVLRYGTDTVGTLARDLLREGIPAVLLFGLPKRKELDGHEAWSSNSSVVHAIRTIRRAAPDLVIWTDLCLCSYTRHGHCGILRGSEIDNDATVDRLGRIAVAHARAGAHFVAPSAMMDHQVAGIRSALDGAGFETTGIVAYAAKFASSFYGPFRDAADSTPSFGDRRAYQMDPRNGREALRELALDAAEGADVLLIKPALPSLDVIARARVQFPHPIAAYQVSGEYAMIRAAAERGWLDERAAVIEATNAIHRAGADLVISYFARDLARWSREGR
ncbi:MAG: porphobilinogen synthase [Thermoplasmata archaeon]|nr:porphobilinogen synthase [Thermoplasmata archaeon]